MIVSTGDHADGLKALRYPAKSAPPNPPSAAPRTYALSLVSIDIAAERRRGTLILAQAAQREAEAAAVQSRDHEQDGDEDDDTEAEIEVAVARVVEAQEIAHRVEQAGEAVVAVEERHELAGEDVQDVHRAERDDREIDAAQVTERDRRRR